MPVKNNTSTRYLNILYPTLLKNINRIRYLKKPYLIKFLLFFTNGQNNVTNDLKLSAYNILNTYILYTLNILIVNQK